MARKLKRYKYEGGGEIPYAQLGQFAGGAYDTFAPEDEYGVKVGANKTRSNINAGISGGLKGAGTGASIGLTLAPVTGGLSVPIGAAIGGLVGADSAIVKNKRAQEFSEEDQALLEQQQNVVGRARLQNYDKTGSNSNRIYAKYGGAVPVKYFNGGNLTSLSEESQEVQGNIHEQGGVDIAPGVELEGGETLKGDFVFSEELGFAQKHKPIARAIGKIEKKVPNTVTNNTIKILEQKEEALAQEQEAFKQNLGIKSLNKYQSGGEIDPPYYVDIDPGKSFRTASEHNKYYSDLAHKKFNTVDPLKGTIINNDSRAAAPIDLQTAIILGGGLPQFVQPVPNRVTYSGEGLSPIKKLGTHPERVKQGYNNDGKLGVKLIR